MTALILGADSATGAYLARLLEARGEDVFLSPGGGAALTALLGPDARVTPVPARDVLALVSTMDSGTFYALNDGSAEQAALVEAAIAAAPETLRLAHVVDADALRRSPLLLAQAKQIAALRRDNGRKAVNAILHNHDSRFGSVDSLPARIIAAAYAAAQDAPLSRLEIIETGPQDWGWTAEYVDAVIRLAALDRPVDLAIGSGHLLTVTEMVEHAFAFFKRDPTAHVSIQVANDAPEPPVDTARLKAATGWSASTWGRDLMLALCEGAAAGARIAPRAGSGPEA
jgi:nucleoside-diphosphate-sugar epimerase